MPDPASNLGSDGFPRSGWTPPDTGVQLAPGGENDARTRGLLPPAVPAPSVASVPDVAPVAASVPAAPKPKARFSGSGHTRKVPLALPIEFDGRTFDSVTVRRLTARDFQAFFDREPEERGRLPAFVDDAGEPIPDDVLDALDFDDNAEVMEALEAFIPRALKADRAPAQSSAQAPGEASPRP